MPIPYEILIRGNGGILQGSHAIDTAGGNARAITAQDLADLAPDINAALLARIEELETELAAALATPTPDPTTIRAWQAKAVLQLAGLLAAAEQVINSLPEPNRTVVLSAWTNNADFSRSSATILVLAAALGLTEQELDALFSQAAALAV